jgi:hypothetical protein
MRVRPGAIHHSDATQASKKEQAAFFISLWQDHGASLVAVVK